MNINELLRNIEFLNLNCDSTYIYGYGTYGQCLNTILQEYNVKIDGYIVTKKNDNCYKDRIYQFDEINEKKIGIILALNKKNKLEVLALMNDCHFNMDYVVDGGKYIEHNGTKRGMTNGSIEFTTVVGCRVNCKYCPQDVLLHSYFKYNSNRERIMSIKTFEKALDLFPKEFDISFGGMSEPFFNNHFMDMLRIVNKQSRKVSLYTTLEGIEEEWVDELLEMPLSFCVLHIADKENYARITKDEKYYRILKRFVEAKKKDGTPYVNICNAQTVPDERAEKICKPFYEILTVMTDRAGNLKDSNLICNHIKHGKLVCSNYGTGLNNNIILPDGTVVLCCMDFGLKHILGNVNRDTYENIRDSMELLKVKKGMGGDESIDILCRNCSYARLV